VEIKIKWIKRKQNIKFNYVVCLSDTCSSCHGVTDRTCKQKSWLKYACFLYKIHVTLQCIVVSALKKTSKVNYFNILSIIWQLLLSVKWHHLFLCEVITRPIYRMETNIKSGKSLYRKIDNSTKTDNTMLIWDRPSATCSASEAQSTLSNI
jgi:hypothetical protein